MGDWMSSNLKKREVVITKPIEQIEELYAEIPENAVITAEMQTLSTAKVKYVLTNDLTFERIRELNKSDVKPIKLDRKNKKLNNTKQKEKRIKCIDTVMAVVNIADFHLNRKVWGKAGYNKDYTVEIATEVFKDIIDETEKRLKASPYRIEKIILNTAGDFLNSDTIQGTTTHGTPQDNDVSWQEAFKVAQELMSYALLKLSNIAPVYHYYVGGNHDQMSGWYLVSWLQARFNGVANIHVDDNPKLRQMVNYGKNLILFAHGDNEGRRAMDLPLNDPDAKVMFSKATNVEVLVGHGHNNKVESKNGIRLEMLNCACPVGDAWTYEMGFGNTRTEASILYYNKDDRVQCDIINTKKFVK
jgi:hypothetical protein